MKLHLIVSAVIISTSINAYSSDIPVEEQNKVEQILVDGAQDVDKNDVIDDNVKIELELERIMKECKLMFPACDN